MTQLSTNTEAQGTNASPLSDVHVAALDGIRGLAILLVMIFHMTVMLPATAADRAWAAVAAHGGAGVDVFFVLSGFLITGILLDARGGGTGNWRSFYARRILRIFPLYYAVVALSLLLIPLLPHPKLAKFGSVHGDAIWYWLHLSNFAIARRGQFVHGILDVSWSLAIEEQFYLVWPAIVFWLRRRTLARICGFLIVSSIVCRVVLYLAGVNAIALYTLTFCRTDGLATGALLSLLVRTIPRDRIVTPLKWVGVAGGIGVVSLSVANHHAWGRGIAVALGHTAWSALTAWLVFASLPVRAPGFPAKLFRARWLIVFGRFSYAMYLFHYPIMALVRDAIYGPARFPALFGSPLPGQLLFYVISMGATLAAAGLSWHLYEKHFLRLKRFFPMKKPAAAAAAPEKVPAAAAANGSDAFTASASAAD